MILDAPISESFTGVVFHGPYFQKVLSMCFVEIRSFQGISSWAPEVIVCIMKFLLWDPHWTLCCTWNLGGARHVTENNVCVPGIWAEAKQY